jgi:hypothetical protein
MNLLLILTLLEFCLRVSPNEFAEKIDYSKKPPAAKKRPPLMESA